MKKKIKHYMIAISVISILLMMILSNLVNYRILSTEAYDDLRACAYAFKGTNAFLDPQNVQYQVEKKSYRVTLIAPDGSALTLLLMQVRWAITKNVLRCTKPYREKKDIVKDNLTQCKKIRYILQFY